MKGRRFVYTAWALAAAAGLTMTLGTAAGLRVNTTASAPTGLWRVTPIAAQRIQRGTIVSICPPAVGIVIAMRDKGYLHPGDCPAVETTSLLKPIVAVPGDTVTVRRGAPLVVNGQVLPNTAPEVDMPAWAAGTYTVAPGQVWLASSYDAGSFDSRYFGPVALANNLRGQATPLVISGDATMLTVHPILRKEARR